MAETFITYEEDDGFEFERGGQTFIAFGTITAKFVFDFFKNDDGYEYDAAYLDSWEVELTNVTDTDSFEVECKLSDDEMKDFTAHLKSQVKEEFNDRGIEDFIESLPAYDYEGEN